MKFIPLVLLLCVGCSSNLGQNILLGRQMNSAAMKTVNDLAQADIITDASIVEGAVEASTQATAAFDDAQNLWVNGKTLDASFALRRAQALLEKVLLEQAKANKAAAEKGKAPPATSPTSMNLEPSTNFTPASVPGKALQWSTSPSPSRLSRSDSVPSRSTASRLPGTTPLRRIRNSSLASTLLASRSWPSRNAVAA